MKETYYEKNNTIGWDGMDKFYDYVPWLDRIISTYLAPNGCTLNGRIAWEGENVEFIDMGIIKVVENIIMVTEPIKSHWCDTKNKIICNTPKSTFITLTNEINYIKNMQTDTAKVMSIGQLIYGIKFYKLDEDYKSKDELIKYNIYTNKPYQGKIKEVPTKNRP